MNIRIFLLHDDSRVSFFSKSKYEFFSQNPNKLLKKFFLCAIIVSYHVVLNFVGKGEAYEEILGKNDEKILEQESGGNDGGVRLHPLLQLSL